MKRTLPTLIVSLGLLATCISNSLAADAKRPNILFIYSDDHSHRTVSCYPEAYAWAKTPNIDKLAKQGVRFTHAYVGPVSQQFAQRTSPHRCRHGGQLTEY